jgi:hypothetical protein
MFLFLPSLRVVLLPAAVAVVVAAVAVAVVLVHLQYGIHLLDMMEALSWLNGIRMEIL